MSAVLVKLIGALFKIPLSSAHCLGDEGFGYFSSAYDLFSPIYSLAMRVARGGGKNGFRAYCEGEDTVTHARHTG